MAAQKRLFLLDAYALIFRGYYAFIKNPRINSKGMRKPAPSEKATSSTRDWPCTVMAVGVGAPA